jgi:Domain of unknown function (DUF4389)
MRLRWRFGQQPSERAGGIILLIPVWILQYVFLLWIYAVSIAIWLVAVVTGKTSASLVDAERFPMSYMVRSYAYTFLLTDKWPPLSDERELVGSSTCGAARPTPARRALRARITPSAGSHRRPLLKLV